MADLYAYTDGACSGNPGPGGWGALLQAKEGDSIIKERELKGGEANTTNNRMELLAAINALESLDRPSALTVVTVGMLPFVGLIIPNLISRHLGDNLRVTLPVTALLGGVFVLGCDILARVVRHPYEVPVGTIFGVLGTLAFLWLIYARPRHA